MGEVPEWLNGTVSKTVVVLVATEGSNPSLSARLSGVTNKVGVRFDECMLDFQWMIK